MKQILIIITLLLTLLPAGAVKKFQPNPINVATVILEKTDSVKVASTCEYYGFTYQGVEDGYTVMKRKDGTEIKFTFNENGTHQKYPTIIVKAKGTQKEIEEHLKGVNFEKEGNIYACPHNIYSRYIKQCSIDSHDTLTFRMFYNQSHK